MLCCAVCTVKLVGWSLMLTPWRDKKDEYGHRSSNLTTPQPTGTSNGILNCVNGVYLFSDPYPLKYIQELDANIASHR